MRVIPAYVHGICDYIGALALMSVPYVFGFNELGGPAVWIARILGLVILLQAMATDFEVGVMRILPMKMHLMNDYIASVFLAASPFLFGFYHEPYHVWLPHVVIGVAILIGSLATETEPRTTAVRT